MLKSTMNKIDFVDIILQKAESQPDKIILKDKWREWTWNELLLNSFQYTESIRKNFDKKNISAIPILVGRSGESVASIIGTIMAGHTFAPIAYDQPHTRIKNIIDSLNLDKVVSGLHTSERKQNKLQLVESSKNRISKKDIQKPRKNHPLYLLFTSGSTGKPKGVLCTSQNILNTLIWSKQYIKWNKNDVIGGVTKFSFDISLFDFFSMIYHDIPLSILDNISNTDYTIEQISNFKITSIFSVPPFFSQFASQKFVKKILATKLKRIISGGDFFPPKHVNFWLKNFPKISIYNVWGPTETSIVNTMHKITKNDFKKLKKGEYASVGKSNSLMPLVLFNTKNEKITKPKEIGELIVLGKAVSIGYFNNSNETQKKYFKFDGKMAFKTGDLAYKDKNGNFYIVGRNDNVVKIQGYRIDLNEIEKNMNNMPNVYAISVFVHRISNSEKELWAAIELEKNETKLNIFKIKNKLRRILPNYMIPKRLFVIPKMPLTPNGKIDKKKVENYISQNII